MNAMSAAAVHLGAIRAAQREWGARRVGERLRVLRRLRGEMAESAGALAASVPTRHPGSLCRGQADTLVAEVLPLIEACRFLEREAAFILASRHESTHARPFWLSGVSVETSRVPLGLVLMIGPANYPLFLPGAQVLAALAAGNAVLWKPAPGGEAAAQALRLMLLAAGLDPGLLTVLGTQPEAAQAAIAAGVDKVFLTGSAATGKSVMQALAETLTPSVMELSGCDAVFVLEGADLARAVDAIVFGLRFNGSATCMAPRQIFVADTVADSFLPLLAEAAAQLPPVPVPQATRMLLNDLVDEATLYGASVLLNGAGEDAGLRATLLHRTTPEMRITQTDIFAPVASLMEFDTLEHAAAAHAECRYALTAAIFGPPREAEALAARLQCGTVLVNDLIVGTADPRVSFGGRRGERLWQLPWARRPARNDGGEDGDPAAQHQPRALPADHGRARRAVLGLHRGRPREQLGQTLEGPAAAAHGSIEIHQIDYGEQHAHCSDRIGPGRAGGSGNPGCARVPG